MNDKEHKEHEQDKSSKRRKVHAYKGTKEILSMQCYGVIGTFTKGVLRTTSNNKEFVRSEPIEFEGTRLSDEVTQAIKNDEAIAATDASVKDENMGGAWIIKDNYRINRRKSKLVSNQWTQNTVIATEAITTLDLVTTVVRNIGVNER